METEELSVAGEDRHMEVGIMDAEADQGVLGDVLGGAD